MPTRTVAAGGGNWNSTATWVGGVVPITGDDIVLNATSGNLTVNVTTALLSGINCTGYTGTITINTNLDLMTQTSLVLSSTMTITGAGFLLAQNNCTITSNGCFVPFFQYHNGGTKTHTDDLTCTNLGLYAGNTTNTVNGFTVYCENILAARRGGGASGLHQGTTIFRIQGTNGTYVSQTAQPGMRVSNQIVVNLTGTLTVTRWIALATNGYLNWLQGSLAGDKNLLLGTNNTSPTCTLDLNNSGTWSNIYIPFNPNANASITLNSNLSFNKIVGINLNNGGAGGKFYTEFIGNGVLNGGVVYAEPRWILALTNGTNAEPIVQRDFGFYMRLRENQTYTFSGFYIYGVDYAHALIDSTGAIANINFTGPVENQNLIFTDFSQITATGNTLYTYKGTLITTSNIEVAQNYVPTSASTFVS